MNYEINKYETIKNYDVRNDDDGGEAPDVPDEGAGEVPDEGDYFWGPADISKSYVSNAKPKPSTPQPKPSTPKPIIPTHWGTKNYLFSGYK